MHLFVEVQGVLLPLLNAEIAEISLRIAEKKQFYLRDPQRDLRDLRVKSFPSNR